jgi:hypothetical protein
MKTGFTVLEFTKIQFLGPKWERQQNGVCVIYYNPKTETQPLILFVVWQSATGVEKTYEFLIYPSEEVLVNWSENIIHIPEICVKSASGDITNCKG